MCRAGAYRSGARTASGRTAPAGSDVDEVRPDVRRPATAGHHRHRNAFGSSRHLSPRLCELPTFSYELSKAAGWRLSPHNTLGWADQKRSVTVQPRTREGVEFLVNLVHRSVRHPSIRWCGAAIHRRERSSKQLCRGRSGPIHWAQRIEMLGIVRAVLDEVPGRGACKLTASSFPS